MMPRAAAVGVVGVGVAGVAVAAAVALWSTDQ